MRLQKTCDACPEQYDVYHGDKKVGYLRLRWGYFSARVNGTMGKEVYGAPIGDGKLTGQFTDEEEREYHLDRAKKAIKEELKLL